MSFLKKYNRNRPLFSLHIPKTAGNSLGLILKKWFNYYYFDKIESRPRLKRFFNTYHFDWFLSRILKNGFWSHHWDHQIGKPPEVLPLQKGYGIFLRTDIPVCIHGHFNKEVDGKSLFDYYPQACQFISFLRDPLEAHLSLYHYNRSLLKMNSKWKGENVVDTFPYNKDLESFVKDVRANQLSFWPWEITENNYKTIIRDNFVYIGLVENMQESINHLSLILGKEPLNVSKLNITSGLKKYPSDNAIAKFKSRNQLHYLVYNYVKELNDF